MSPILCSMLQKLFFALDAVFTAVFTPLQPPAFSRCKAITFPGPVAIASNRKQQPILPCIPTKREQQHEAVASGETTRQSHKGMRPQQAGQTRQPPARKTIFPGKKAVCYPWKPPAASARPDATHALLPLLSRALCRATRPLYCRAAKTCTRGWPFQPAPLFPARAATDLP